jgi:hypothetical protein
VAVLRAEKGFERENRFEAAAEVLRALQAPVRRRHSAAGHFPCALASGEFLRADPFVDLPVQLHAGLRVRGSRRQRRTDGCRRERRFQRAPAALTDRFHTFSCCGVDGISAGMPRRCATLGDVADDGRETTVIFADRSVGKKYGWLSPVYRNR